ncbi:hypothetical protein [Mycobacterium deserti]|uniref:Transmembrane protein n=1 Tax=Mycobacterium deserti TaxID=2978347 RepID=A0ABT2MCT2_9MYCO|nr:hypothetical protein [Mycobacterium deserti]MCT7660066.1 hypothetical protein [Mycobacterium deserti]
MINAPTLITEQQVRVFTAAAVALPSARSPHWTGAIVSALCGIGVWMVAAAKPPAPRPHPKRRVYLENALMSREKDRL